MKKLLLGLYLLPCIASALDYKEFDEFQSSKNYKRGEVVRYNNNLWVSRWETEDKYPSGESLRWAKVQLGNITDWSRYTPYVQGDAASYQGKFYLSKRQGPFKIDGKYKNWKWVEFTHPALRTGYDLPDYEISTVDDTIDGHDTNGNGLRDDFEIFVIMENKPEYTDLGMRSGHVFQRILNLRNKQETAISTEEAAMLMAQSISLRMCISLIYQSDPDFSGFQHRYINTVERFKAYREGQLNLHSRLGNDYQPNMNIDPCARFNELTN